MSKSKVSALTPAQLKRLKNKVNLNLVVNGKKMRGYHPMYNGRIDENSIYFANTKAAAKKLADVEMKTKYDSADGQDMPGLGKTETVGEMVKIMHPNLFYLGNKNGQWVLRFSYHRNHGADSVKPLKVQVKRDAPAPVDFGPMAASLTKADFLIHLSSIMDSENEIQASIDSADRKAMAKELYGDVDVRLAVLAASLGEDIDSLDAKLQARVMRGVEVLAASKHDELADAVLSELSAGVVEAAPTLKPQSPAEVAALEKALASRNKADADYVRAVTEMHDNPQKAIELFKKAASLYKKAAAAAPHKMVKQAIEDMAGQADAGMRQAAALAQGKAVKEAVKASSKKKIEAAGCPEDGCVTKRGDKWRVVSNKTGKLWPQEYDSKEDAEDALAAYHVNASTKVEAAGKRNIKKGDTVRMTGKFLRNTGQVASREGKKRWKVLRIDEHPSNRRGAMAVVDEKVEDDYFTAEELKADPSLKYRRILLVNLEKVGGKSSASAKIQAGEQVYYARWDHGAFSDDEWAKILKGAKSIMQKSGVTLGDKFGKGKPTLTAEEISFNGVGDDRYESVTIRKDGNYGSEKRPLDYNMAKLEHKPYGAVAADILRLAKKVAPQNFKRLRINLSELSE